MAVRSPNRLAVSRHVYLRTQQVTASSNTESRANVSGSLSNDVYIFLSATFATCQEYHCAQPKRG